MPEVVTLGESMVLFNPISTGPLQYVSFFQKQVAGAESNFAIGIARLGHSAGWISRVGDDEFGRAVLSFIRGEGVDVSQVKIDPHAPTGIYFKERREIGETRVYYYRSGSAASRMTPEDLDPDYIASAEFLHVTGITPALGDSCLATVARAIEIARANGVKVSFDPNIRLKLWSGNRIRPVLLDLMRGVDIILAGRNEGKVLFGLDKPEELIRAFKELGASTIVIKLGAEGAVVSSPRPAPESMPGFKSGSKPEPGSVSSNAEAIVAAVHGAQSGVCDDEIISVPAFQVERTVDTVGAGDAFAAGFIVGLLKGWPAVEAARLGNAMGAYAVTVSGDVEGLPTWTEVENFLRQER